MKKKVSLITIFDNINFGTYLQSLATALKINELGGDVTIIWYEREHNRSKVPYEDKISLLRYFRPLYAIVTKNKSYWQKSDCRKFVSRFVKVSRLYYTYDELLNNTPDSDIYVTGSDQVWNTDHNKGMELVYYLSFVPAGCKKCSFSSSIGMDYIDPIYKNETKRLLEDYDSISVREYNAVELLGNLGIRAEKVVDPTFLLRRCEWEKLVTPYVHKRPYVLVYSVEWGKCDEIIANTAKDAANHIGGDIIEVNYVGSTKQIRGCDLRFEYANPETFLSLFLGASFAVISSFHGTAFALNLGIPFITIAPERYSSRIDSLLAQTNTVSRKLCNYDKCKVDAILKEDIDFNNVNKVIGLEREKSLNYIKNNILND